MDLLSLIPYGHDNAIPRRALSDRSGLPDRKLRKAIQRLRESGELIHNRQDGLGYYRVGPEDLVELKRQYWQDTHRISTISRRRRTTYKLLKQAGVKV